MKLINTIMALTLSMTLWGNSNRAVPKFCYDTLEKGTFCTTDNFGKVQVLYYNGGFCPPCNEKMPKMGSLSKQYNTESVQFASLSCHGWQKYSNPDSVFLAEWKAKHSLPNNYIVAGKYLDCGKNLGNTGGIPYTVILNKSGEVVSSGSLSVSEVKATVDSLIKRDSKSFFESIKGTYHIDSINEKPIPTRSDTAEIMMIEDLPNTAIVAMPFCQPSGCFDSGNIFPYEESKITQTINGYHIELNSNGETTHYEWEVLGEGKFIFRNLKFNGPFKAPIILEHVLTKLP